MSIVWRIWIWGYRCARQRSDALAVGKAPCFIGIGFFGSDYFGPVVFPAEHRGCPLLSFMGGSQCRLHFFIGLSHAEFLAGTCFDYGVCLWSGLVCCRWSGGDFSWVLPAFTLGTAMMALQARMLRASLLETGKSMHVTAARARGLPERTIWLSHILWNASLPVLTVFGLQVGAVLTGVVVVETVFAWPGLGLLLMDSIHNRDYPVVQGCVLFISLCYVVVNFLTDIGYCLLDPRVRLEGQS